MKTISQPLGAAKSYFASRQESCRKDVERAFGMLQSRFAIVRYPAFTWSGRQMSDVMSACVIMHNMIIKSERKNPPNDHGPYEYVGPLAHVDHQVPAEFADFLAMHGEIRDRDMHFQLQADLIEHLWNLRGQSSSVP